MLDTEPEAAQIRYAHYAPGPDIPDPSPPDAVAVQFHRSGTTCHGRLDGLTGDRPHLEAVECGVGLLTHKEPHPKWAAAGPALLATAGVAVRLQSRHQTIIDPHTNHG